MYSQTHGGDLLQQRDTKQNQLRIKVCGVQSRGDQEQASKGLFPVESQVVFNFPQGAVTTPVNYRLPEKLVTDSVSGVFTGTGHIGSFCWART